MRKDFDNCSGLTLCNISPTTPDEFASIYTDSSGRYRIMGALLESDVMGKACQVVQNPFYSFIIANATEWGTKYINVSKRVKSGLVDVEPFVSVGRKGIINNNYWKWEKNGNGGTASNGQGYDIKGAATSLTSIPAAAEWFPERTEVHISGLSGGGTRTQTQWLVVFAEVSGNGVTLYLRSRNSASKIVGAKLETPTTGVLFRGVPNVHPAESYCQQIPRLNTNAKYLAWIQDTRWFLCNDELTKRFKQHVIEGNPLYREYFNVEEADYNKQVTTDFQNRLVHQFLFGKALPNQTESLWPNLDTIQSFSDQNSGDYLYLPGIEGRCVGRRASAVGVYEQLSECGRVIDCQGQPLNIPELQKFLYDIHRLRKDNGLEAKIIEIVVDSAYRVAFIQGLFRYMQAKYEGALRATFDIRENEKVSPDLGFVFQDFPLDYPAGVTLRVVSHLCFDDFVSSHTSVSSTLTTAGRFAWIFDWSTIYMAMIESRTVELTTGTIQEIAKINADALCRMEIPTKSVKHYSMKWTVVVDCPAANLWLENFSDAVPEHAVAVGATDGYGDA